MINSAKDRTASQAKRDGEHQQGKDEHAQDQTELPWYPESYPKALSPRVPALWCSEAPSTSSSMALSSIKKG